MEATAVIDRCATFPSPCASGVCDTARLLALSDEAWRDGRLEDGITLAGTATRIACDAPTHECVFHAHMKLALLLSQIRRFDQAWEALDAVGAVGAVGAGGAGGAMGEDGRKSAVSTLVRAQVTAASGDLAKAVDLAKAGLGAAEDAGLRAWIPVGHFVLASAALRQGELATAIRYARQLQEDAVFGREMLPAGQSAWAVVQVAEADRGREKTARLAAELLLSGSVTRQLFIAEPAAAPWLVRLVLSAGDTALAAEGVRAATRLAERNPGVHSVASAALHAAGLLENDVVKLRRAAELHVDPWARASAIEDLAIALARTESGRAEAAETYEEAMRIYLDTGSLRDSSRVRSRLRSINANPNPRDPGRPRSGVPSLTDTEYAVAKLAAQGFTNGQAADQLFLSRHTVAFHLRKIFRKVGVCSRVELAREWSFLDVDGAAGEGI
ncbi:MULTISPECIES: helix-turn-helix transcriptional regulator [unclassified Streptomyces]|uniref:helix-turn-helix transcriptional regulator n=1 Tax=unclassified Streptomyces TaxID=2593676 RepID=UPI001E539201|nr:helix-turn-helix transcriptional regulator [Streptomyces sp. CB02980]MCB8908241.1 helix-turn-helix transcriptional regulator [Streptomyces sp. CB02980]